MIYIFLEMIFFMLFPTSFFIVFAIILMHIARNFKRINNHNYFKHNTIQGNSVNLLEDFLDVNMKELQAFQNQSYKMYKENYNDVSKEKLELFNVTDINELKDYFYKIFLEFEKAYNNLDYKKMQYLSTNQLYENYYTGISLDLKVGNKRIIDNIEKKKMTIYELDSTVSKQVVSTLIEISYNNYMVNKNGDIISGKADKITEKFIVQFRKDFAQKKVKNCPNCGAPFESNKCPYCETIVETKNDFKISSIKRIV